ncbi:hypothetical protein A2476_01365, partial [candidate division CPR3 bacterium RIFOXYC2_FULL_35_7]
DGSNDFIDAGGNPSLNITGTAVTYETWIKVNETLSSTQFRTIMLKATEASSWNGLWYVNGTGSGLTCNNKFMFGLNGIWLICSSTTPEIGKWYHIAARYDGSTVKIFINGVEESSVNYSTPIASTSTNQYIGKRSDGYFLKGFLDETKIYSYARSANNIISDYIIGTSTSGSSAVLGASNIGNISNGLIGYWKMEETVSPSIDSSGNSNNGTWNGDTTFTTGKYGDSISLDGTGDYVTTVNSSIFSNPNGSISLWFNSSITCTGNKFLFGDRNIGNYIQLWCDSSDNLGIRISNVSSYDILTSGTDYIDGKWHQTVITWGSNGLKLYVDGIQKGSNTYTGAWTGNNIFYIGTVQTYAGINDFNGQIDEFRIYNRALSYTEIQQLYNYAPSPYVYWKFDENTGNTVNNSSINVVTGTLNGTGNHWNEGKRGKTGSFGGNTYADFMSTTALNGTTFPSSGTITFWFKINNNATWNNWNGIVSTVDNRGDTPPNWFNIDKCGSDPAASQIYVYFTNSSAQQTIVSTTSNFGAENGWTYFTVIWDQSTSTVKIYANSKLDKFQDSVTTWPSIFPTFQIAKDRIFSDRYFDGLIDDFKIYNYARTPSQIVEDMNGGQFNGNSALGYWKFDEGYSDTSYNSGFGTSMNGNLGGSGQVCPTSGNVPCPAWTNYGKYEKALTFDGTDDFVELGTGINSSSITLSAWVNFGAPTGAGSGHTFISKGYQTEAGEVYWLYADAGNDLHFSFGDGINYQGVEADAGNSMTRNVWNHVVATFDNGKVKLYVNGKIVKDTTSTVTTLQTGQTSWQTQLGKYWTSTNNWLLNGYLDEVQIYNFALTQDKVNLLYNQGESVVLGSTSTDSSGNASSSTLDSYCPPGQGTTCVGPTLEWKFDENQELEAHDSNNNIHQGTITGGDWKIGRSGSAMDLNNTLDRVLTSDTDNLSSTSMTLNFWFKWNASQASWPRIGKFNYLSSDTQNEYAFQFKQDDGRWYIRFNDSGIIYAQNSGQYLDNTVGKWHSISITYDSVTGKLKIVQNGSRILLDVTNIFSITPSAYDFVTIGNTSESLLIDNVQYYNYARNSAQIAWDYNQGQPIVNYSFNECEGNIIHDTALKYDRSISGYNGTWSGSGEGQTSVGTCETLGTAWGNGINGKYNSSLNFDGLDDIISGTINGIKTGSFTVSSWIKPSNITSDHIIFSTSDLGVNFQIEANGNLRIQSNTGLSVPTCSTNTSPLLNNSWQQAIGIYSQEENQFKIYLNGILVRTCSTTGTRSATGTTWYIGRQGDNAIRFFAGQIDDLQVFNYALNDAQVKIIYNQNSAVKFD